tara:strand:- start:851 stop:1081 length:231 start_codon:yes stop_codon:yes gene_type:complete
MTRKKLWAAWLKFADKLGTIQMMIILTVIYWTFVSVMAIPFKLFADPLILRKHSKSNWKHKSYSPESVFESMKRQY